MKSLAKQFTAGIAIALATGLSGCGDAPPAASIPNPESASSTSVTASEVTTDDVQREVGEAVDTASAYADQSKDEYQAAMQKKLDELDAKIDKFQARTGAASEDAKVDAQRNYEETMRALREKRQALSKEFDEFKEASSDAWRDVATGLDAAWDDVSSAFSNAADRFQDPEEEPVKDNSNQDPSR